VRAGKAATALPRAKQLLDHRLPHLARWGREATHAYRLARAKPEASGLGFAMLRGGEFANRLVGAELPAFVAALDDADLFVDIGANVGFFTLIAARRGVPVVAVEPDADNAQLLYRNLQHSANTATVEVLPVAVSDRIAIVTLRGTGQEASLVSGWGGERSLHERLVPTTTLDTILAGRAGRLLIKMDVEGHESAALRGAMATLARTPPPVWLIEHGPVVGADYLGPFDRFWENGYEITALPERAGAPPYTLTPAMARDWSTRACAPELMFLCRPRRRTAEET
jgi:FkbM family methyltransferase